MGLAIDAIRDYTSHLSVALANAAPDLAIRTAFGARENSWQVTDVRTGAVATASGFQEAVADAAWVIIQYNPFSYGRWGIAPWLPCRLLQLRQRSATRVALMCHEAYMPLRSAKYAVMGFPQRLQIAALAAVSDVALAPSTTRARQIRRWCPRTPVTQVPVGSNLPDARADRDAARHRLGIAEGQILVAAFGRGHPSRQLGHVARAIDEIAAACPVFVLNLGAGAPDLDVASEIVVLKPGVLDAADLASYLAAADLCLLPYDDGASTRRTTLVAALQQQLCVITTDGHATDSLLREASDSIRLVTPNSAESFAAAAVELALDPTARAERGRRGRALFERAFAWESIATRMLATLGRGGQEGRW